MRTVPRWLVAALALVALLAPASQAGAKPTIKPSIISLALSRHVVPASGGRVRITARVTNTRTCRFLGFPTGNRTYRCRSGRVTALFSFPPSSSPSVQSFDTYLEVVADNGRNRYRKLTITQAAAAVLQPQTPTIPPPPVRGLQACSPGPHCFYGPAYDTYPTYGNVAPALLGDCAFAAAAHWQQIVLGRHPDPTQIGFEFADAGGTEQAGVPQNTLWQYWRQHGIGGTHLTGLSRFTHTQADVENGVRRYQALIAELQFKNGDYMGTYQMPAGVHDVVVDGFTPAGPLVVTWGQTLQMTWQQWNILAIDMWAASAA
jgi:hypothetical protein